MGNILVIYSKVIWKSQVIVICKILRHVFIAIYNLLHGCSRRRKHVTLKKEKKHSFDHYIETLNQNMSIYILLSGQKIFTL